MPRPPSREERKAATRAALVSAGAVLVRARGFGVSVEEVAHAAGLTKGAVYSNFAGRAELIQAIAQELGPGPQLGLAEHPAGPEAALEALALQIAAEVDRDPTGLLLNFDLAVTALRDPALAPILADIRSGPQPGLELHAWAGRLDLPPGQLGIALNAVAAGLALFRLLHGAEAVPDELFRWLFRRLAPAPLSCSTGPAQEST